MLWIKSQHIASFYCFQQHCCHIAVGSTLASLKGACTHAQSLQSCLILCNPMDYSLPGSSVHGILQARILEWVAISFSRGSSGPRDWTQVSWVFCIGRWILYHGATWEAPVLRGGVGVAMCKNTGSLSVCQWPPSMTLLWGLSLWPSLRALPLPT